MSKIYILKTWDSDIRMQVPVAYTTDEDFAKELQERFLIDISEVCEAKDYEFRLEERKFKFYLNKQLDIIHVMDKGLTVSDLYTKNYAVRNKYHYPSWKGAEFAVVIFAKDEDQAKSRLKNLIEDDIRNYLVLPE